MRNFDYYNPVKILFGKGKIAEIAKWIPKGMKVMMTYGGGSIKKNGVYEQVMDALQGFDIVEFGGIEPNPKYETLMRAVELAKQNAGYYVFDNDGNRIYPEAPAAPVAAEYKVNVTTSDLRIRKGPGTTFDYWKKEGKPVYTGKGAFTIVEEAEGPGASKWGLLKAYAAGRNGWVPLDYTKKA